MEFNFCPSCKRFTLYPDEVMNSLSRKDNKTYVCNECGTSEAAEEFERFEKYFNIQKKAATQAARQGWKFIDSTMLPHPDDAHLIYTIVEMRSAYGETYATHLFNETLGEEGSFNFGHYDFKTLEMALADLRKRVN